jgi:chlorophyll synthase
MAGPASSPAAAVAKRAPWPVAAAALELLKPITWFPPMWAFACGVVASGVSLAAAWPTALLGIALAGPLVCAMSQAVNDWFDRHVDAVNEPHRPIPSGRLPGRSGLWLAIGWTLLSLGVGWLLGPWGFAATLVGVALAWAYSAPPLRLKREGWTGNAACALSYETLPWVTAAAVLAGQAPGAGLVLVALLYGVGAHGIMTLNDFKSIEGDRRFGIRSLPVQLGPARAARLASVVMAVPQVVVVALLLAWGAPWHAGAIALSLLVQLLCMAKLLRDPRGLAPWYNATGVSLYVLGMMVAAAALRGMPA